ncbi:MAG: VWA domain-containing protein [Candidatus Solibacter usitatus]|nr:VWA domain-containing protein [Candidatus Solibacter usitatus]
MHRLSRRGALAALAGSLAAHARGQQPQAQTPDDQTVIRVDTRLVVLHCSVLDKSGRLITNLPQSAFKVFENGQEQSVKLFRREDIPVSLGIVIDNSGSMRDKRLRVEAAAVKLVKASNPEDEVFIVNFNDDAYLDVPFTNQLAKMEEGLARIDSRGGTAMRDAVSMSVDHVRQEGKKDKKVLLVVTDGNDTVSTGITLEKLVEKVQKSEVLIYGIGILGKEDARDRKKAQRAVDALTKASGGASFYPGDVSEVEALAAQVAHDIRSQYVVAYSPTNQSLDGSFRTIKVTANSGKYTVRTRTGYYASPEVPKKRS